jgi:dTDP-4-dehydrorhamnose reductase
LNLSPDTSVFITGASGVLGWALARRLSGRCRVVGTHFSNKFVPDGVMPVRMDLADPASVDAAMETWSPHVIVHAAAMTDPDDCERDPAAAVALNLEGSARVAAHAARVGAKVVFISTDLVFDGMRGRYAEGDAARPLSTYGRTKLEAERVFLEKPGTVGSPGAAVVRSSLIYGWGSPASGTFFSSLRAALASGRRMRLFTDQMRNPVLEDDIAAAVVLAIEHDLEGLYHVGGPDAVSRYEFGRAACDVFGLDPGLIEPITMSEFEYIAGRPLDSTLDISRFVSATGFAPLGIRDGLGRLKQAMPD